MGGCNGFVSGAWLSEGLDHLEHHVGDALNGPCGGFLFSASGSGVRVRRLQGACFEAAALVLDLKDKVSIREHELGYGHEAEMIRCGSIPDPGNPHPDGTSIPV
jgi:hypothetical protein